jgi:hypothetical protein
VRIGDGIGGQIDGGGFASKQRSVVGHLWRYIIGDARSHAPILESVIGRIGLTERQPGAV